MAKAVDLSEFGEVTRPGRGKCWFTRLTTEQQDKVDSAVELGHTYKRIAQVVTGWGVCIGDHAVSNHFTKSCACGH